jgi:hypothetical protein
VRGDVLDHAFEAADRARRVVECPATLPDPARLTARDDNAIFDLETFAPRERSRDGRVDAFAILAVDDRVEAGTAMQQQLLDGKARQAEAAVADILEGPILVAAASRLLSSERSISTGPTSGSARMSGRGRLMNDLWSLPADPVALNSNIDCGIHRLRSQFRRIAGVLPHPAAPGWCSAGEVGKLRPTPRPERWPEDLNHCRT